MERNAVIAAALSLAVLLVWQYLILRPIEEKRVRERQTQQAAQKKETAAAPLPPPPPPPGSPWPGPGPRGTPRQRRGGEGGERPGGRRGGGLRVHEPRRRA